MPTREPGSENAGAASVIVALDLVFDFASSRAMLDKNQGNNMLLLRMALLCAALASMPTAVLAQKAAPKDALIYIILPENGDTVRGAFWCRFGLRNMGVGPANSEFPNVGHHHLLIDTKEPIIPDEAIPHDKKHLHFGGGETEALLDLPPGKHTLQLVLSDSEHISFNPPLLSKRITIMVKGEDDTESENVSRRSKHRADHRTHRSRSASSRRERKQVEQMSKSGQEECPYQGLMRLFKNCQEATAAAAAPTKPPSTE
jgi:hypothetical protein